MGERLGVSFSAYSTSLSCRSDVDALCKLEDEFIKDHRLMLRPQGQSEADEELFEQIGLNSDAEIRRNLVASLACSTGNSQRGDVRHFTVACHSLPPWYVGLEELA